MCPLMRVGKVDSPDAGAGAEVEDKHVPLFRTAHQLPILGLPALLVKHVHTFLLLLVVGQWIPARVVVYTAIFFTACFCIPRYLYSTLFSDSSDQNILIARCGGFNPERRNEPRAYPPQKHEHRM